MAIGVGKSIVVKKAESKARMGSQRGGSGEVWGEETSELDNHVFPLPGKLQRVFQWKDGSLITVTDMNKIL